MPFYRLDSSSYIQAPGFIAWAINGYAFESDRAALRRIIVAGWPAVPEDAAHQLLSGSASHAVDGATILFFAKGSAPKQQVGRGP